MHSLVGPCHDGTAHPQVADGGRPPIWRVAANIMNKQSPTADKGWSSNFGVSVVLKNHRKKLALL